MDDSVSIEKTQIAGPEFAAHSIESSANELAFSSCTTGALSLGVKQSSEKAIIAANSMHAC